jgi:XXXCH domain-containing protein
MDFRTLKTHLEKVYAEIVKSIDVNTLPELETLQEFTRMARMMPMFADDEWIGEAEDFAHLATQIFQAAKNNDFKTVVRLAHSLDDAQRLLPQDI